VTTFLRNFDVNMLCTISFIFAVSSVRMHFTKK
jgi:hypothetical protein